MRVWDLIYQNAKNYHTYISVVFLCMCTTVTSETLRPLLIKHLIDGVSFGAQYKTLWVVVIYFGMLRGFLVVSITLTDYCTNYCTPRMQAGIAEHFMQKLYYRPYVFFHNQLSGNINSKLSYALQYLPILIFTIINSLGYFVLLMLISLALMYSLSFIFAVILLIWSTVFLSVAFFSIKKSASLNKAFAEEKSHIIGLCADYINNILTVKMFTTKKHEISNFRASQKSFIEAGMRTGKYHMVVDCFLGIISSIYAIGFMGFLVFGYSKGMVGAGDFAFVVMTNFNIISTTYNLSKTFKEFVVQWSIVDNALSILEEEPEIPKSEEVVDIIIEKGKIEFDNVTFGYADSSPLFVQKSLVIEPGQKVGLVGYSGSGKSSFVNLILKLYEIDEGRILIDDQDISAVSPSSLRHNISVISQDLGLFHRSLKDNIRYGNTSASDAEVLEASKKAHAHGFITQLPNGYESLVGEKGIKLSSGQRQRIAIARAILKNAPILILDEATSQLDTLTESTIQASLLEVMKEKTTIVIAHRLSTLLSMDRIIVFDRGIIVQDGAHLKLLEEEGLYKILWETQVGGFLPAKR